MRLAALLYVVVEPDSYYLVYADVFPVFAMEKNDLHVTACFFGRKADQSQKARALREFSDHVGCVDKITLLDIVVTQQTVAIRVKLPGSARRYYKNDDAGAYQGEPGRKNNGMLAYPSRFNAF